MTSATVESGVALAEVIFRSGGLGARLFLAMPYLSATDWLLCATLSEAAKHCDIVALLQARHKDFEAIFGRSLFLEPALSSFVAARRKSKGMD